MDHQKPSNTFNRPPSLAQVVAYSTVITQIVVYSTCVASNFASWRLYITMSTLFAIVTVVLFVSWLLTSMTDPSDKIVKHFWRCIHEKVQFVKQKTHLYCGFCQSYCHHTSKHCHSCKHCIYEFDHHCIWINNCIGSRNYRYFFVMMVSAAAHMLIFIVSGALLTNENMFSRFLAQMVVVWIVMVVVAILCFLDIGLLMLHIYLNAKGISTYQFVVQRREQIEREENAAKNEFKSNMSVFPQLQSSASKQLKLQAHEQKVSKVSKDEHQVSESNMSKEEIKQDDKSNPNEDFTIPKYLRKNKFLDPILPKTNFGTPKSRPREIQFEKNGG